MKIKEAEKTIRSAVHHWAREKQVNGLKKEDLSFYEFWRWLDDHHPEAKEFRATMGAQYMAELWFDEETGQTWTR